MIVGISLFDKVVDTRKSRREILKTSSFEVKPVVAFLELLIEISTYTRYSA